MAISLYDLGVPTFLQTMRAIGGVLDRGAAHFAGAGIDADGFVLTRLYPDMAPFRFQIEAAWHHAVWGVEALLVGEFAPPSLEHPTSFARLQAMIAEGVAALEAFSPQAVDACAGKALDLRIGPRDLAFTAEAFILSFSLPHFHFHAVTAYDILRAHGVPIGKRDYEGALRLRA